MCDASPGQVVRTGKGVLVVSAADIKKNKKAKEEAKRAEETKKALEEYTPGLKEKTVEELEAEERSVSSLNPLGVGDRLFFREEKLAAIKAEKATRKNEVQQKVTDQILASAEYAGRKERKKKGIGSTILTGGQGVANIPKPARPTLIGG